MTAHALNITAPGGGPIGPGQPAGPNAAALAANPLAGFEALLASLFPQPAQAAGATAGATKAGVTATPAATPIAETTTQPALAATPDLPTTILAADAKPAEAVDDLAEVAIDAAAAATDAVATDETAPAIAADPNTALAVCLLPTPTLLPEIAAKAPTGEALEGGPLRGRIRPLTPFNLHPGLHAGLANKAEHAPEATPEGDVLDAGATAPESQPTPAKADKADQTSAPAWGREKAPGAPAAPALLNASPKAELAQKAEAPVADLPSPPVTSNAAAPVEAPVLAATAPVAPRTDVAPTRPAKSAKAERAKGADEVAAADDLKAPAAADKPATARAVNAAARPAEGETGDAAAHAPKIEAEQPEATPLAETRAAEETSAPAVHAAPAVRGSPETVANLAAQILKKLESKSTRFDLELNPMGLGKVNVRVEIGAQGALTAAMSFDNPQAAAELRGRAAELQKALEQAGFNLTGALSFDVAGDRGQQQQPGQGWQDQAEAGRAFRGQAFRAALETADDAAQAATNGALRLRRGVTAGLDVRI